MENSKTAIEHDHDEAQIRSALAAILDSDQFRRSPRLREFLTFIVERKLAGAEDQIVGKAIAEQVYGRNLAVNAKDESLVRVDAGRVRRALADYYAGSGKGDSVEFAIPVGSYRPIFSSRQTGQAGTKDKHRLPIKSNHLFAAIAAVLAICIVVLGAVYFRTGSMDRPGQAQLRDQAMREKRIELVRRAMFQKSPASLQAYDFAQQARGLIFPPTNPDRLKLARQHFEDAIALDPEFYGGYAGAAQVMAFLAFLPWVPETEKNLEAARDYSAEARNLAPGNAWVQSSLAWVAFVAGEFERAKELAALALDLDPLDWHVTEFGAMIYMFSGDFDVALKTVRPLVESRSVETGLVHLNVDAIANFHLGNFRQTIDTFNLVIRSGGTNSPVTISYLAAAYGKLGDAKQAAQTVAALKKGWPRFSPTQLFNRIYRHKNHAREILAPLRAAGWTEPDG